MIGKNRMVQGPLRTLFDLGAIGDLTDGQLLERFATGRKEHAEEAFTALVERHGPMVLRVCRGVLRDDHEAQDAFQATFLVLVRKARALWVRESLGPWLHQVAYRTASCVRSASGRRRKLERRAAERAARLAGAGDRDAEGSDLHEAIDRLPEKYRVLVVLCDLEDHTHEQAARQVGCPVGTVKSRLARARELLRARLDRRGAAATAGLVVASTAEAAPSPALVEATARAAAGLVEGSGAGAGVASATVMSLTRGVSTAMSLNRLRRGATVALMIVVATAGAAALLRAAMASSGGAADPPKRAEPAPEAEKPAPAVGGVVLDEDGLPVAGATVVVGQFGGGMPNHRLTTTGPDGRFGVRPGGATTRLEIFLAYKEGYAPASIWPRTWGEDRGDTGGAGDEVTIRLSRPEPFQGVVKDREGRPVPGASVHLQTIEYAGPDGPRTMLHPIEWIIRGTPLERMFLGTTDERGEFRFPAVPRGAKGSLTVTAKGMGRFNSMNQRGPDGGLAYLSGTPEAPAEVVLAPAARVVGRIVTRLPKVLVGGRKVALQGSRTSHGIWGEARSDVSGRFAFDGLPEGTANVFLDDIPNDAKWTYRAAADTVLSPGRTTEVEIELIEGVLAEGKVIDGATGTPVAEVGVGLYGPIRPRSGAAIISTQTDKEGRYRFRLPPGETDFYICGPVPKPYGRPGGSSQVVRIPDDTREFRVPDLKILPAAPGK